MVGGFLLSGIEMKSLYRMLSQNPPNLTAPALLPAPPAPAAARPRSPGEATAGRGGGTQGWFFFVTMLHLLQHLGNLWRGRAFLKAPA